MDWLGLLLMQTATNQPSLGLLLPSGRTVPSFLAAPESNPDCTFIVNCSGKCHALVFHFVVEARNFIESKLRLFEILGFSFIRSFQILF
jgi:hypothetical protein